ncbi:DUF433 domain-containing protein [Spirosoma fluminis]
MNWQEYIVANEEVLSGKSTIKGTRLSVEFLLERPSVTDADVTGFAIAEQRIILTFDGDYGTLIFK